MAERGTEEKTTEASPEGMSDSDFIALLWRLTLLGSILIDLERSDPFLLDRYNTLLTRAWVERLRRKKADPSLNMPITL